MILRKNAAREFMKIMGINREELYASRSWQVWYCVELDILTIWTRVDNPAPNFKAVHNSTDEEVTMVFIGEL